MIPLHLRPRLWPSFRSPSAFHSVTLASCPVCLCVSYRIAGWRIPPRRRFPFNTRKSGDVGRFCMARPAPPAAKPGEYIQTAATGNKISRRSVIYGASNIVFGGKCIVHTGAMIRGDLVRVIRSHSESRSRGTQSSSDASSNAAPASASSVIIVTGRYMCLVEACLLRPPAKTYHGYVPTLPTIRIHSRRTVSLFLQVLFLLPYALGRLCAYWCTFHCRGCPDRKSCRHRRTVRDCT